ncbi:MAG: nuclear receptor-binding factor 2 [Porphyromonas sp.]|nr:nuclear receptor-binding factor 2 [Porphyromonas sp.]
MSRTIRMVLPLFVIVLLFASCNGRVNRVSWREGHGRSQVYLEKITESNYKLHMVNSDGERSSWELPYPVYRFDYGNIWGDSTPEIVVGVEKSTRFDPVVRRRLFVYRIADNRYIRPLWLGSRMGYPLYDFRVDRSCTPARVRTVEQKASESFLVSEYEWRGFGLKFVSHIEQDIRKEQAMRAL